MSSLEHKLKDNEILCFLHIPKTSGSTFTNIIDSYFDLQSIYPYQLWYDIENNTPPKFNTDYKLVRGHFEYGIHKIFPNKTVFITVLRNPIERTLSHYEHIRRNKPLADDRGRHIHHQSSGTLEQLLTDQNNEVLFRDIMGSYIASDYVSQEVIYQMFGMKGLIKEDVFSLHYGKQGSDLLETAKQRLSQFPFIGIAEKFEESLSLFYYTFGFKPQKNHTSLNVARKNKTTLSKDLLDRIKELVKFDLELYEYATKIFDIRYSQMIKELTEKYYEPSFDYLNAKEVIYQMLEKHHLQRLPHHETVESMEFDMSNALLGTGWYGREFYPNTEVVYRWMGPDVTSTIHVPLSKDNDVIIRFGVILAMAGDILQNLRLTVNEHPIKLDIINQNEFRTTLEGKVPKMFLNNGNYYTTLGLHVNRTVSPGEEPIIQGERRLSLAIDRFLIIPAIKTQQNSLHANPIKKD